MPPALVSRADIVEVGLDCKPIAANAPRLNGERVIPVSPNGMTARSWVWITDWTSLRA
jgi:hypothetical protein